MFDKLRSLYYKYRNVISFLLPLFLIIVIYLSTRFAISNPHIVERYYSNGLYRIVTAVVSSISSISPLSLTDIVYFLVIGLFFTGILMVLLRKIKLWFYLLIVFRVTALAYALLYLLWGYNYFRAPLGKRMALETGKPEYEQFRNVFDTIILRARSNYISIAKNDYSEIDHAIEESYRLNSTALGINYPNGSRRAKTMIFSRIITKVGISGYFGPFFNEVHVNRNLLPMEYPFLLAHEKAHQFGIAGEAEANLAAYIICATSDDKRLRYSSSLVMTLYFLSDAFKAKDHISFIRKMDRNMLLDLRFRSRYYGILLNEKMEKIQSAMNDAYLKSNNISSGINNYNEVVSLVINWEIKSH